MRSCRPSQTPLTAMSDYTIYLTDEEVAWIAELRDETGAKSRSRVLRDALENYRAEILEGQDGPEVSANGD